MTTVPSVTFADRATLAAYDALQVPTLFRPWAEMLAGYHADWAGRTVLDLATGSGILIDVLAPRVGASGEIIGVDPSGEMLDLARRRCDGLATPVRLVRSGAHALPLPDASVDVVVCQQGFQFFADRAAAAAEMHRVLRPGGSVIAATWSSLADCDYFRAVHDACEAIGEPALAAKFHVPFDGLSAAELAEHFAAAGFAEVHVQRRQRAYTFKGGMEQAVATAWSTVAGPQLARLAETRQQAFRDALAGRLRMLTCDGCTMGRTAANVPTATRTGSAGDPA